MSIPENQGRVDSLLCIAAIDAHGKPVRYSIASPSDGRFAIGSASGMYMYLSSLYRSLLSFLEYTPSLSIWLIFVQSRDFTFYETSDCDKFGIEVLVLSLCSHFLMSVFVDSLFLL